jgi:hypothetical protein
MAQRVGNVIYFWEIDDKRHNLYCGLCQHGHCGSISREELLEMDFQDIARRVELLIDAHQATEEHWKNESKE